MLILKRKKVNGADVFILCATALIFVERIASYKSNSIFLTATLTTFFLVLFVFWVRSRGSVKMIANDDGFTMKSLFGTEEKLDADRCHTYKIVSSYLGDYIVFPVLRKRIYLSDLELIDRTYLINYIHSNKSRADQNSE